MREPTHEDSWLFCLNARSLNNVTGMVKSWRNIHDEGSFGTRFRCEFVVTDDSHDWFRRIDAYSEFRLEDVSARIPTFPLYEDTQVPTAALLHHCTPVAVLPTTDEGRALQQRSAFTLHGGKPYSGQAPASHELIPKPQSLLEVNEKSTAQYLVRGKIPGDAKEKIRFELQVLGFHEATLFPDADTLGAIIKEMF